MAKGERRTATADQLRKWVEEGLSHAEIGRRLGRTRPAIASACAVLGITSYAGRRVSREEASVAGGAGALHGVWGNSVAPGKRST